LYTRSSSSGEKTRDQFALNTLGLVAKTDRKRRLVTAEDLRKRLRLLLEILVHRVRCPAIAPVAPHVRSGGPDHHELLGIFHREQAEHQLVDQRKNGGIGADAKRQRCNHHRRKQRATAQVAERKAQIG
jgi:hypothetical protein